MDEKKISKYTPVYRHSAEYSFEHGEDAAYRDSFRANITCKNALEKAINDGYSNNTLNAKSALEAVRADFSMERIEYVLANTIQQKPWDGRISRSNKEWANNIAVAKDVDSWDRDRTRQFTVDQPHTGLVNIFVNEFRKEREAEKKPSILAKLKTPAPSKTAKSTKRQEQEL